MKLCYNNHSKKGIAHFLTERIGDSMLSINNSEVKDRITRLQNLKQMMSDNGMVFDGKDLTAAKIVFSVSKTMADLRKTVNLVLSVPVLRDFLMGEKSVSKHISLSTADHKSVEFMRSSINNRFYLVISEDNNLFDAYIATDYFIDCERVYLGLYSAKLSRIDRLFNDKFVYSNILTDNLNDVDVKSDSWKNSGFSNIDMDMIIDSIISSCQFIYDNIDISLKSFAFIGSLDTENVSVSDICDSETDNEVVSNNDVAAALGLKSVLSDIDYHVCDDDDYFE